MSNTVKVPLTSRDIEHAQSQDKGLARQSTRAKTSSRPVPIHPGFADRTDTSLGAPSRGTPPDASSPSPLDPTITKSYPIPEASWGMKGGDGQGLDKSMAHNVMSDADEVRPPDDFARSLHTKLPQSVEEN